MLKVDSGTQEQVQVNQGTPTYWLQEQNNDRESTSEVSLWSPVERHIQQTLYWQTKREDSNRPVCLSLFLLGRRIFRIH